MVFFFLINLFNYHTFYDTTLQSDPHSRLLGPLLQLDSINVSLILLLILLILFLGQALQLDQRLLSISLLKDLTLLDLRIFFYVFYARKKNNLWRMPLFFLFFSFLSLLLWTAHSEKADVFSFFCFFFFFNFFLIFFLI